MGSTSEFAGVKVRALLLARRLKEGSLVDADELKKHRLSPGFFLKYLSRLVHGKVSASSGDRKLKILARQLDIPVRLLEDDRTWPEPGKRHGLSKEEIATMSWLRSLYKWYIRHAGLETAHKYLSLDFDVLHRQTQLLQGLARTFGSKAVIKVFVGSDYEEGRFDREFSSIERIAMRNRSIRRTILDWVQDVPVSERVPGRSFLPLTLGKTKFQIRFTEKLPKDRPDVRYEANGNKLKIHPGMTDERLAFVLARLAATRIGDFDPEHYDEHHWPCNLRSYAQAKSEALLNRMAASLLVPRNVVQSRARGILENFTHEVVDKSSHELCVGPETLLLRIVQIYPKATHFIRIDAPAPDKPFTLQKLFRGNGLPIHHRYSDKNVFPETWGVIKSLRRFFGTHPRRASAESRHVQITRIPQCGNQKYVCMSLTFPRFGGGAKALCIGFVKADYKKLFGKHPAPTEKKVSVDESAYDVDWAALMRLETESRKRGR